MFRMVSLFVDYLSLPTNLQPHELVEKIWIDVSRTKLGTGVTSSRYRSNICLLFTNIDPSNLNYSTVYTCLKIKPIYYIQFKLCSITIQIKFCSYLICPPRSKIGKGGGVVFVYHSVILSEISTLLITFENWVL